MDNFNNDMMLYSSNTLKPEDVVAYCATNDPRLKQEIYSKAIEPAFDRIISLIIYKFHFSKLIEEQDFCVDDCKTTMLQALPRYDVDRGLAPFFYFNRVARNWFFAFRRNLKQAQLRGIRTQTIEELLDIDYVPGALVVESPQEAIQTRQEFIKALREELTEWFFLSVTSEREKKLISAVHDLLQNAKATDIVMKKELSAHLVSVTGLTRRQVGDTIPKLRKRCRRFRERWQEGAANVSPF